MNMYSKAGRTNDKTVLRMATVYCDNEKCITRHVSSFDNSYIVSIETKGRVTENDLMIDMIDSRTIIWC